MRGLAGWIAAAVVVLGYGGGMNDPFATAAVHAEEGPAVEAPSQTGFDGLGLSPEQRAEIERIRAESKSGIEALREEMRNADPANLDALGLSSEQRAEIERIRDGAASEIEALREEMRSGDPEQRQAAREALRARREEVRGRVGGVLTDEQRQTLEERRAERQASRRDGAVGGRARGARRGR